MSLDYQALLRSESATKDQLATIQNARLKALLRYAIQYVPYWRRFASPYLVLTSFPTVNKQAIKAGFGSLISSRAQAWCRYEDTTSGTSGVPFHFWTDRRFALRRSVLYQRVNSWAGVTGAGRILRVLRQDIPGQEQFSPFYRFLNVEQLAKDRFRLYRLLSSKDFSIYGFASFLIVFSQLVKNDGVAIRLRAIISMGETLPPFYRKLCEEVFQCPVFDCYSMREFGRIAQECAAHKGMHINAESFFIEILDDQGAPVGEDEEGRIIITAFDNFVMPFIRYDSGDRGRVTFAACPCGRTLPRLLLEGRSSDLIRLADGRTIYPSELYRCFNRRWGKIKQFQIYQRDSEALTVRIVPTVGFNELEKKALLREITDLLGEKTRVTLEMRDHIDLTPGGKTTVFVSELNLPRTNRKP